MNFYIKYNINNNIQPLKTRKSTIPPPHTHTHFMVKIIIIINVRSGLREGFYISNCFQMNNSLLLL